MAFLPTRGGLLLALSLSSPQASAASATEKLARRCEAGQTTACAELADRWQQAAEAACHEGAAAACEGLAEAQLHGLGVNDPEKALWAWDRACFLGITEACARMALVERMEKNPERAFSPLTVELSDEGIRIRGPKAALFSSFPHVGDELWFTCYREEGCQSAEHFDWDLLSAALRQIAEKDPGRQQAVLRYHGVQFDAVLEATERLAGRHGSDQPLFPWVVLVEGAE